MKRTRSTLMAVAALVAAGAARAAIVPAEAVRELRAASQQLQAAAMLKNAANDQTEAQHLLAARDLLREADPYLDWSQRQQARMLEHDIRRDVLAADAADPPSLFSPMPSSAATRVAREDLGELAQRSADLAQQAADAGRPAPAAGS